MSTACFLISSISRQTSTYGVFGTLMLCLCSSILYANDAVEPPNSPPATQQQTPEVPDAVVEQVRLITEDINRRQKELRQLEVDLANSQIESDKERIQERIDSLNASLELQYQALEQIATGAVDLTLFEEPEDQKFSWQAELKEVLEPVIFELKKISERPRQIERLKSEQLSLQTRIEAAAIATEEIRSLRDALDSEKAKRSLDQLLTEWQTRLSNLKSREQVVSFQLNEKLVDEESRGAAVVNALESFITGRGANLVLSLLAFFSTFAALRYLSHWLEQRIGRGKDSERRFYARVIHIIFQILTVVFALLAMMATLYVMSDWLILTLVIILIIGFLFALRNSLPTYIEEVRLLLNLGPVREGERVMYGGLPWKVSRLNIYSDLVNPLLTGGRIRVPIGEMLGLVSRRWSKREPWFPSKPTDFVVLSDGTFGEILLQTPEIVKLSVLGKTSQTYSTSHFLAANPINLTEQGFGLFVTFGLDYGIQEQITTTVVNQLEKSIQTSLADSEYQEFVEVCKVEFSSAGASSLDLKVIAMFSGEAAKSYYSLQRFIQKCCVDACNEHGWVIPFTQITLHGAEDLQAIASP